MYPSEDSSKQQQRDNATPNPYTQPQQPGYYQPGGPYQQPQQPGYYQQPGGPYQQPQQPGYYQPGGPYQQPQQPGYYQPGPYVPVKPHNGRANRAMIQGFISIGFSLLTLFSLLGAAGLITGTLAIIYGFMGLNAAGKLPNNAGRGQAITGIVLGFVAWFLVILSFILRSMH